MLYGENLCFSSRRFFHNSLSSSTSVGLVGREMDKERLTAVSQLVCDHAKQRRYCMNQFDILNGFEVITTKCSNCHKTLALEVKKIR